MTSPPSGLVTFLFTDVEGSTLLWDRSPDVMRVALTEHDRRMRLAVEDHGGYIFTTAGDSFAVSFQSPRDALAAAIAAQTSMLEPAGDVVLKVRMALHTGIANLRDGDYFGVVVNRCARLMSAGHGGQILVSQGTADLLREQLEDGLELVDLGEHRLKDLAQPERIFQLRHPELDSTIRRLRAMEGPANNLPAQLTSFVGRGGEVTAVRDLLSMNRLVTLTGAGGAGKTRLALHVADGQFELFPDGTRLVELAAVTDGDVFVDEVAEAVGAHAKPDVPLVDTIAAAIGGRRMLLVLDNCEHIDAAVAGLVSRLLQTCQQLKVLTTSRRSLGVDGERVYHVPPMALPPAEADVATATGYDAVRLFVDRARLSNPEFALDPANVADISRICRQLDGIPLAIELAAARLRVMSPAQIASRLVERFGLLVGKERAGSQRHRTLQATIDWSHNLLDDDQRVLFRRLSAFSGDFSLEAAEQVCGFEPLAEFDVLDVLSGLVDNSMVAPEHGTSGTRYRLLESMRQYGRLRLVQSAESALVADRHLEHYARLCESLQARQRAGELGVALALRNEEEDNLRAALRWAMDERRFEFAARIIGAVGYLWYAGGLYREGIEWCRELFAQQPQLSEALNAAALHAYGTLLGSWAQPVAGAELLGHEVEIRRTLGDPVRLASALNNLGNVLQDIGQFDEGESAIRESIELFRSAGESPSLAFASLGSGALNQGDYERATKLYDEALTEALAAADSYGVALATELLGVSWARQGRLVEGRRLIDEARRRFEELNVAPGVADADFNLAVIDRDEGRTTDAAWRLLASLSVAEGHWYQAAQYWTLQLIASIIADEAAAARLLGAAMAHYERSAEIQSAFVLSDLAATTAALTARLGAGEFLSLVTIGRTMRQREVVAEAIAALHDLIDGDSWSPRSVQPVGDHT